MFTTPPPGGRDSDQPQRDLVLRLPEQATSGTEPRMILAPPEGLY
jgi:hypothetical protein